MSPALWRRRSPPPNRQSPPSPSQRELTRRSLIRAGGAGLVSALAGVPVVNATLQQKTASKPTTPLVPEKPHLTVAPYIIGMGDSIVAGAGAGPYYDNTNYRSPDAGVHVAARQLDMKAVNIASSGALAGGMDGQLAELENTLKTYGIPKAIVLSIGANDQSITNYIVSRVVGANSRDVETHQEKNLKSSIPNFGESEYQDKNIEDRCLISPLWSRYKRTLYGIQNLLSDNSSSPDRISNVPIVLVGLPASIPDKELVGLSREEVSKVREMLKRLNSEQDEIVHSLNAERVRAYPDFYKDHRPPYSFYNPSNDFRGGYESLINLKLPSLRELYLDSVKMVKEALSGHGLSSGIFHPNKQGQKVMGEGMARSLVEVGVQRGTGTSVAPGASSSSQASPSSTAIPTPSPSR